MGDPELEDYIVSIYPNPNNGEFTIEISGFSGGNVTIDVFDITGRKLFTKNVNGEENYLNTKIELPDYFEGPMLLKINNGIIEVIKPIIVE